MLLVNIKFVMLVRPREERSPSAHSVLTLDQIRHDSVLKSQKEYLVQRERYFNTKEYRTG